MFLFLFNAIGGNVVLLMRKIGKIICYFIFFPEIKGHAKQSHGRYKLTVSILSADVHEFQKQMEEMCIGAEVIFFMSKSSKVWFWYTCCSFKNV